MSETIDQRSVTEELYAKPIDVDDISSCYFYHTVDLPGIGLQKGEWDLRGDFDDYVGRVDFTGKRVLDVGCGSGFLSFSAEERNASEVVSFDMDDAARQHWLPFHDKLAFRSPAEFHARHNQWLAQWRNAYWLLHKLKGSKAKALYGDVYNFPREAGEFDIVLVCSLLEHLSDPIRALASLSRVARSHLVITTPVIETDDKIARFHGDAHRPEIDYVWWVYSMGVYSHVLRMLGFGIRSVTTNKYLCLLSNIREERTTIVATRNA
jgi:SAM-dependent methyltransferase